MQDRLLPVEDAPVASVPAEYRRLSFIYQSLSKRKKEALNELATNPYALERYNVNFKRVCAIRNIPRLVNDPKKGKGLLLNFSEDDLLYFMECYRKNDMRALLYRSTNAELTDEIKSTKDSSVIELLSLLQLMQNGKTAKQAKRIYSSIYKEQEIQHFFHRYNEKGLGFDLYLHSRKGIIWFLNRAYREAFVFFGITTTMMWACKLTMGNLGALGFSQTEYMVGTLFVAGQVIYNNPQSIAGLETTSVQLGLWLRLMTKAASDLILCRPQKVRQKTLTTPFIEHAHGLTSLLVFAVGNLFFKSRIESFFRDQLDLDVSGTAIQRTFEPYIIIISLLLIAINHLEAFKHICFPCKECQYKTEKDEEPDCDEEAALEIQTVAGITDVKPTSSLNGSEVLRPRAYTPTLFAASSPAASSAYTSSVVSDNGAKSSPTRHSP